MALQLVFTWVDVFAPRPLAGNQLCVFRAPEGVEEGLLRRIARELNHSETAFLQAPTAPGADARVRILLPTPTGAEEIPFAGHPVLGSACVAASWAGAESGTGALVVPGGTPPEAPGAGRVVVRLETGAGVIPVTVTAVGDGAWEATMAQPLPRLVRRWEAAGGDPDGFRRALAAALGLETADLRPDLPVEAVDNGMRTTIIPLASVAAVRRARPDAGRLRALLGRDGDCTLIFAPGGAAPETDALVRVFSPFDLVAEDPATGSANGPLGEYLVRHGLCPGPVIRTEQGESVGRPGRLRIEVRREGGQTTAVLVGGRVCRVGSGAFEL